MKKSLIFVINVVWLLTVHLWLVNAEVIKAQPFPSAQNPQGDLWGKNQGGTRLSLTGRTKMAPWNTSYTDLR